MKENKKISNWNACLGIGEIILSMITELQQLSEPGHLPVMPNGGNGITW